LQDNSLYFSNTLLVFTLRLFMRNLLIVESAGKIKKLKSILGAEWDVKASIGHIRQLASDGDGSLGFDLGAETIDCRYIPRDDRAKQTISGLIAAANQADAVFIASDPDREGEVIGWHIAQVLKLKQPQRVVYQEITESAVKKAIASPRSLDMDLVEAGRCRDCLDKLVGYKGSPLIWRLNNGAKSVGRVQSATLHLVCQREREIQAFTPQDYWSVFVDYAEGFRAFYHGTKQVISPATEDETSDDAGAIEKVAESTRVLSQAEAERLVAIGQAHPHQVQTIEGKLSPKKPPAPFITSSLQQAAGSRLKFSPEHTMSVAQKLYEAGLITYMRTDSVELSQDFCKAAREWLSAHDKANVPSKVAKQRSSKDAQEAHEAVRPTDLTKASSELKQQLSADEFALYLMIWMRSIASQCKPAQIRKTTIVTQSGEVKWQARGQMLEFAGYAKYWKDISGDAVLPSLQPQQPLTAAKISHEQKQTQPPPRYSEPKLVQLMERRGIGRPSTYAPTIATLKQRNYVELVKSKVQPTTVGLQVDDFLIQALPELIQSEFTAQMETQLDAISKGKQEWQSYLIEWNQSYFGPALSKATQNLPAQDYSSFPSRELEKSRLKCPTCSKAMSKVPTKKVKKGYFLKCEDGCKDAEGKGLVMFWSDRFSDGDATRTNEWQLPRPKTVQSAPPKLTSHPCPICQQPLEEYSYSKDGQAKSMLRCSDAIARSQPKHKDVAYFRGNEQQWWSPKLGNLGQIKDPAIQVPTN
jgi:DNA topoisomerase I